MRFAFVFILQLCVIYSTKSTVLQGINYSECGVPANITNQQTNSQGILKILGGINSNRGQWPWMALITKTVSRSLPACGGALLNENFVVTAASCFVNPYEPTDFEIVLGRTHYPESEQRVTPREILIHPSNDRALFEYDVALVQLSEPASFTRNVRPVCLPPPGFDIDNSASDNSFVGRNCTVLGWGTTVGFTAGISFPRVLQSLTVPIYSDEACQNITYTVAPGDERFCAGGIRNQGTCSGDSGGPLLCLHQDNRYYVHGVVSTGFGCGLDGIPDIYADLGHLSVNSWIRSQIQ